MFLFQAVQVITGTRVHNLTSFIYNKRLRHCLNSNGALKLHKNKKPQVRALSLRVCTVQALVSQGISIALGCAFTTQPADHLIVSPQSRGSNLRGNPPIPVVTSPTENKYFFYQNIVVHRGMGVKKKMKVFVV